MSLPNLGQKDLQLRVYVKLSRPRGGRIHSYVHSLDHWAQNITRLWHCVRALQGSPVIRLVLGLGLGLVFIGPGDEVLGFRRIFRGGMKALKLHKNRGGADVSATPASPTNRVMGSKAI